MIHLRGAPVDRLMGCFSSPVIGLRTDREVIKVAAVEVKLVLIGVSSVLGKTVSFLLESPGLEGMFFVDDAHS